MTELKSELLYEMQVELEKAQEIGSTPHGRRRIIYVKSGTFEGPRLKGEVLPGGGDWFLSRPDNVGELDIRATMRTDDGHLIYASYRGLLHGGDAGSGLCFRTTPYYETASEKYGWLNRIVAVGMGRPIEGGIAYEVYAIL